MKLQKIRKVQAVFLAVLLLTCALTGCGKAEQEERSTEGTGTEEIAPRTQSADETDSRFPVVQSNRENHEYSMEDVEVYTGSAQRYGTAPMLFIDGEKGIPYINETTLKDLMTIVYKELVGDAGFNLTSESDGGVMQLTRENGYGCIIDYNQSEILFDDFNCFTNTSSSAAIIDTLRNVPEENGSFHYLKALENPFEVYGDAVQFNLEKYGIDLFYVEDTGFMPLQTFSDIFLSYVGVPILYNGKIIIIGTNGLVDDERKLTELGEMYYDTDRTARSSALARFSYNSLCLALDCFYGLKEEHNITSFDHLFFNTGLKDEMLSEDPVKASEAIKELCYGYFADFHSAYSFPSPYTGLEAEVQLTNSSLFMKDATTISDTYAKARNEAFPNGWYNYEEVGDTAYITFDVFERDRNLDYYEQRPTSDMDLDTYGIISYANDRIRREGSPIKNVVLDLSNNGGGADTAAAFVISWFLGKNTCDNVDTFTGAQCSISYVADVNFDGKFDEKDNISDLNLYCLISPASFSNGNYVPAAFKSSDHVTLLGKTSGGGACNVKTIATADGNVFQYSCSWRINTVKNGSFYQVDRGVDPDQAITKIQNFYDRKALTEYIHNLY